MNYLKHHVEVMVLDQLINNYSIYNKIAETNKL